MRGRDSVLSEEQKSQLQVENFIYHIIKKDEEKPEYLEEVHLANDRQKEFFRKIIAETGQGTQYKFINDLKSVDKNDNTTPFQKNCESIIKSPDKNFVKVSRLLAQDFLSRHTGGSMSDGVLIVARVTIPVNIDRVSFLALLKLDYTPVMRQHRAHKNGSVVELEEVLEALSEQKTSVQKRALVNIGNEFEWDVLAVERKKTGAFLDTEIAITDYFKNFMGIRLKQNDSSLTKKIVTECHAWAKSYEGDKGNRTPADIRHSVISYIDAYEDKQLDYDEFKDIICRHEDSKKSDQMKDDFDEYMADKGLKGISFSPKPKSIPGRSRKGIWETDTGIQIIWDGQRSTNQLKKEVMPDGAVKITIIANKITEKE